MRTRASFVVLRALAVIGVALCSALLRTGDARTNVVVLVLSEAGDDDSKAPILDALRAQSALFENVDVPAHPGRPSDVALLSGRTPRATGVQADLPRPPLAGELSVATAFSDAGYLTLAAGGVPGKPRALGFARGGDDLDLATADGAEACLAALEERAAGTPFFLWWTPGRARSNADVDGGMAALIAALAARGEDANTLYVVVRERSLRPAARFAQAGVPRADLAFRRPSRIAPGPRAGVVTTLDLVPTLLASAELAPADDAPGLSLLPVLEQGAALEREFVHGAVYLDPELANARAPLPELEPAMIYARSTHWRYVLSLVDDEDEGSDFTYAYPVSEGQQQLFDLAREGAQTRDVSGDLAHAEQLSELRRASLAWWTEAGGEELRLPPLFTGLPPEADAPDARPNIVLIVSDDQDYKHLGFLRGGAGAMPTTDRLAAAGVVFDVAHVSMSRCRPSLATLLSGRYPHQSGILDNQTGRTLNRRVTLPGILKRAGYATFVGGKFWEGNHHSMGFIAPERQRRNQFVREDQDDLFAFLDEHARTRPFFVWWAPLLPHGPFDAPERYRKPFAETAVAPPVGFPGDASTFVEQERTAFAMEAWFDDGLTQLCDKLRALGEFDNTLFCFLIDNGWSNARPSKGSVYEQGLRTPVFFSWKDGFAGGRHSASLVSTVDIFPTLLDFAGERVPANAIGKSLRAELVGAPDATPPRDVLCGAAYVPPRRDGPVRPERDAYALYARTADWKYVLYVRRVNEADAKIHAPADTFAPREFGDENLFDLARDPDELADLSADPAQAERMAELRLAALDWWEGTGGRPLKLP